MERTEIIIPPNIRDCGFVKLAEKSKKPFEDGWQQKPYSYEEIAQWVNTGKNYGTLGGHNGLLIVDADTREIKDLLKRLPTTFSVKTKKGQHAYYYCPELTSKIVLKRGDTHHGEILSRGCQAVAPGSIHPDTGKPYTVENDAPIASVSLDTILETFSDFISVDRVPSDTDKTVINGNMVDVLARAGIKFRRVGGQLLGPHPIHGSTNGGNVSVNVDENVWHCFRCNSGGGILSLVAVLEGIIDCSEALPGGLRGEKYKETLKIAKEKYQINIGPDTETEREGTARVAPLRAATITEMLNMEFPPREAILSPWCYRQGLAMIHGGRGVGKTHVGIGIGVAVSSGGNFLRWAASTPAGVLYVDGEMPGVVIQERLAHAIETSKTEPIAPLKIITPDLQEAGMCDLSTEEGQIAIEPHLSGVSLIILDNLSTLCRTGRENEGESWLPVQEWALRLRSRGFSVIFIHHDGKGGQQRGTSRKEDVLDAVIHLKHPGDYSPEEGARFEILFEKARGIFGEDVKPFEAKLTTNAVGTQEWTMKTVEDSLTERVADLLNEGVPQQEIAEMIGVAKGTVSKHKKKAQERGLLK